MSRCWRRCRSGSPCSWCTWRPSPSPAPASTRRGASAPPSSTTTARHGVISGSSGLGRSSGRRSQRCTTRSSFVPAPGGTAPSGAMLKPQSNVLFLLSEFKVNGKNRAQGDQ
uniref:cDNA clone:002-132-C10, full insert sequence n=1 Tax=Oryza sativa subsp. japonica TaxID=39947 RepID=B7F0I1_ORYSJ|nr:unnamed protein product [Oryza sativa Japonica Group]